MSARVQKFDILGALGTLGTFYRSFFFSKNFLFFLMIYMFNFIQYYFSSIFVLQNNRLFVKQIQTFFARFKQNL